ncbi:retrovirus-related pol polyprotein from transposon 17.6 [Tanacetum coccineum]
MGGLKPEIADGIRMFKPTNLKDATSLGRMRDEHVNRLSTMKRITWDEMQKKRAQCQCFNCDEKISVGDKCKEPQLRVMESDLDEGDYESFVYQHKFQHLEDIVTKFFDAVLSGKGGDNYKQAGRLMFYSKLTKLEFARYRGDEDLTEWFTKFDQFYENLGTLITQKFGPTDFEDFDEALLKVQQSNPFREYQKEFERLGNRVRGWTQKALVGTFMGGLKPEIANGIRMFKTTNLKDAISLARMRDEQLNRLSPITQASSARPTKNINMKRFTWDEIARASNKDRIDNLEVALGQLQDGIAKMKISFADKFQHLEDIMTSFLRISKGDATSLARIRDEQMNRFSPITQASSAGPTKNTTMKRLTWDELQKNRAQGTPVTQKVSLASYHLQGEAKQWWRWLRKANQEEGKEVTCDIFYEELWSRFGSTDFKDFDEALLKALVGTFIGGLKLEIADGIRMFKPTNLEDATSLVRMRDEQLNRLLPITQASSAGPTKNTTMKWLTWDDMQKKRAQGLCFNCDEKFSVGHKFKGPQLRVMESAFDEGDCESFIYQRKP